MNPIREVGVHLKYMVATGKIRYIECNQACWDYTATPTAKSDQYHRAQLYFLTLRTPNAAEESPMIQPSSTVRG